MGGIKAVGIRVEVGTKVGELESHLKDLKMPIPESLPTDIQWWEYFDEPDKGPEDECVRHGFLHIFHGKTNPLSYTAYYLFADNEAPCEGVVKSGEKPDGEWTSPALVMAMP